ncbi:MAG: hypothetical protein HRT83_04895 [Hyphomicrobiaceae bacterium]|nr:hypothetical protein [Hyphomicrobiaceae bacterium]
MISCIGPDLLREDAAPAHATDRIIRSRARIRWLLTDHIIVADISNIYRTVLLWRAYINPNIPCRQIAKKPLEALLQDAKYLLEINVKHNKIITIEGGYIANTVFSKSVNVFDKTVCPACGHNINCIDIAGRRAFVYMVCQPPKGLVRVQKCKSRVKRSLCTHKYQKAKCSTIIVFKVMTEFIPVVLYIYRALSVKLININHFHCILIVISNKITSCVHQLLWPIYSLT